MAEQKFPSYRLPDNIQPYAPKVSLYGPWVLLGVFILLPVLSLSLGWLGLASFNGFQILTHLKDVMNSGEVPGILFLAMLVLPILLLCLRKSHPQIMRWLTLAATLCPVAAALILPMGLGVTWGGWLYFLAGGAMCAVEFQSKDA